MLLYDISNFMSWFVQQVVNIFTQCFNIMNSIEFGGTSLLKVIIFISIIIPFLGILLTIVQTGSTKIKYESRKKDD